MRFTLTFTMDNDVFSNDSNRETARILRDVADRILGPAPAGTIRDHNGNRVGSYETWKVEDGDELIHILHRPDTWHSGPGFHVRRENGIDPGFCAEENLPSLLESIGRDLLDEVGE